MLNHCLPTALAVLLLAATCLAEPCPTKERVVSRTLGGAEVKQTLVQLATISGKCLWALKGSTPTSYTTESCQFCSGSKAGVACKGPSLSRALMCRMVLGPDCRYHKVDPKDSTKKCDPMAMLTPGCPRLMKRVSKEVGGEKVTQELVHLQVASGECAWVLKGSSATAWTKEDCSVCSKVGASIQCRGPSQSYDPMCRMVLGPNCRYYKADPQDTTKKCDPMAILSRLTPMTAGDVSGDEDNDDDDMDLE